MGSVFGIGRQKIAEGDALDFVDGASIRESTLFYTGLNLELGYQTQFSDYVRFSYKGILLPTIFYSEFDEPSYSYGIKKQITTVRWRTEFEQTYAFQPTRQGGFEIGAQLFGGQQPTPVKILPRIWDSIHQIKFLPDFGTLVGVGGVGRVFTAEEISEPRRMPDITGAI